MNRKTNAIKWLAVVTMTVDHIGYYLFPEIILLRMIGRIAFPCFLYTTIQGVKQTGNFNRYFFRILGTALISMVVMSPIRIYWNILFSLALFALSLHDKRLILPTLFLSYFTEYSIYGYLFGWAIKIMVDYDRKIGFGIILILHLLLYANQVQLLAMVAIVFFLVPLDIPLPKFPKWLGYFYYPVHQLVLYAMSLWLFK